MNILVTLLLICGLVFFLGGSVGIIRYPDFYSRLHPAGKLDTGGLVVTMSAFALYTLKPMTPAAFLTAAKLMLIVVFVFITSPTAIHAIVDAGVRAGLAPWEKTRQEAPHGLAD